jgi:hypothetical protein
MSTNTLTNYDSITTGESKLILDKVILQIANGDSESLISDSDVAIISYAIEHNLQLRDYLMGLANDTYEIREVINILNVLVDLCNQGEVIAYHIETVIASYMYQIGDSETPIMLISALEQDYPLAKLLKRLFLAEWDPKNLTIMSKQLHPEIIEELTRTSELIVNENLR